MKRMAKNKRDFINLGFYRFSEYVLNNYKNVNVNYIMIVIFLKMNVITFQNIGFQDTL